MNPNRKAWLVASAAMMLFLTLQNPVAAQAPGGGQQQKPQPAAPAHPGEARELSAIPLKHIPAHDAAALVHQAVRGDYDVAVDSRSNSLLVSSSEQMARQISEMLSMVDVPLDAGPRVAYFTPEVPIHDDLIAAAKAVCSRDARILPVGNVLVVHGSAKDTDAVGELLERVQLGASLRRRPANAVDISFHFISARLQPTQNAQPGASLPPPLADVADALAANGFHTPRLLAPVVVRASATNEPFSVRGTASGDLQIEIEGSVSPASDPHAVQLRVDSRLVDRIQRPVGPAGAAGGRPATALVPESVFELETSITARMGEYVVLAASPSRASDVEAVILVVRVDPRVEQKP